MPVSNRIKILECKNFEEVENKVNDFLAFDEDIAQLVTIDYRLEYNVVIIEYNVLLMDDEKLNKIMNNLEDCSVTASSLYSYNNSNPFTSWWKLCFPFYRV